MIRNRLDLQIIPDCIDTAERTDKNADANKPHQNDPAYSPERNEIQEPDMEGTH